MQREPEPELMEGSEQVRAYAEADFAEAHDLFVALLRARFPHARPRRALDLGCGPCDVTRRFARAYADCSITAVDGSGAMLAEARMRNRSAGLAGRKRSITKTCAARAAASSSERHRMLGSGR